MNKDDLIKLEIERQAYLEVVKQFTKHNIDIYMNIEMEAFLKGLLNKISNIENIIERRNYGR